MMERSRTGLRVAAVAAPVVVAAVAGLARAVLANTSAALVLVLVVLAVAVAGDRVAGVLAAVSAGAAFDVFLTAPYGSFVIDDPEDVETAVLLLVIGIAVTEIALWGRRHQARSDRRRGYLDGVAHAARMAADGSSRAEVVATVQRMITDVLDLDSVRHEPGPASATDRPAVDREGTVTWRGERVDVAREGLPTMDDIELPDGHGGRFLLTASTRVRRPDRERLQVAVTLAEQVPGRTADQVGG